MHCSNVIWKDVRAVESDCATQEPRRALRIARPLSEILLLCLRRTRLERKSTKNLSKIDDHPPQIEPKSKKNRSWAVLGAQGRFGDASGRARDGFWTPKCRPEADLGAPRASQERQGAVQKHRRGLRDSSQDDGNAVRVAERSRKHLRIDFLSIFGQCAEAPKRVSYWFLQCFVDVGRFTR